jgi:hypothetical protein
VSRGTNANGQCTDLIKEDPKLVSAVKSSVHAVISDHKVGTVSQRGSDGGGNYTMEERRPDREQQGGMFETRTAVVGADMGNQGHGQRNKRKADGRKKAHNHKRMRIDKSVEQGILSLTSANYGNSNGTPKTVARPPTPRPYADTPDVKTIFSRKDAPRGWSPSGCTLPRWLISPYFHTPWYRFLPRTALIPGPLPLRSSGRNLAPSSNGTISSTNSRVS